MANRGRLDLREWLDRQDLTQVALAGQLQIAESTLSLILSGRMAPGLKLAVRIEKLTGIPASRFVNDEAA